MNTSLQAHRSPQSLNRFVWLVLAASITLAANANAQSNGCKSCQARVDWTTMPSKYSHDAAGQRVDQFAKGVEPYSNERSDFERSGYRNYRSSLQAGNTADNLHIVESWGKPVRPYEEWRFPYRPYSVPYGEWGPQPPAVGILPFGGVGPNIGAGPYGAGPYGAGPYGAGPYSGAYGHGNRPPYPNGPANGNMPNGNMPNGPQGYPYQQPPFYGPSPYVPNPQAPWINGYWQQPEDPSMSDREFFNIPRH